MNREDCIWLAGYLEGEGSFMTGPPSRPHLPIISLETTDEDIAERVAILMGVSHGRVRDRGNPNWKPTFRVHKRGAGAVEVMNVIYPFMSRRRKTQIELAVASLNIKPKRRGLIPESIIIEIRNSTDKQSVVAKKFNLDATVVRRIRQGVIYNWVE